MHERMRFIVAVDECDEPFAELCRRFGISRKTGYKWLERYEAIGPEGLEDKPPVSHQCPHRLSDEIADLFVLARKAHPTWGPKKLRAFIQATQPEIVVPAASTIGELLKNHGLIHPRRRRLRVPLHTKPLESGIMPNGTWCADFKGHFALGNGKRCHPLTITDEYSRYLLACEGMDEPKTEGVTAQFERCFREFGMPQRIRTDNGAPFASNTVGGLSKLSVWWIKLGITPERIEPGKPEQNGRHERMHRTLKDETTKPARATLAEQQRAFDYFRHEYNDIRPHEALQQKPPSKVYTTSGRAFPEMPKSPEYGDDFVVRKMDECGRLVRRGKNVLQTRLLAHEPVGLREVGDARWNVYYGSVMLGTLDETDKEPRFQRAS